ncbi:hypothetical protein BBJ28_00020416 [Nothophytophthora sp. Chile5]|nr:hypothetical protein BBJ28_00020416 [Nothophytophthora sp. Chile5]
MTEPRANTRNRELRVARAFASKLSIVTPCTIAFCYSENEIENENEPGCIQCSLTNLLPATKRIKKKNKTIDTNSVIATQATAKPIKKMLGSPLQIGDALLGRVTTTLVFAGDHLIPAVHKIVSWDSDDSDLGPIIPVRKHLSCRAVVLL